MRKTNLKQLPLMNKKIELPHAFKLQEISRISGGKPIIIEWVLQDLVGEKSIADTEVEGVST